MRTSSPTHPYESPRGTSAERPDFSDRDAAELIDLRRRVEELERRVKRSWMVHPNIFSRVMGVLGHFLLGHGFIIAVALAVGCVIWSFTGQWILR
jgi:hypothetical protein